VKFPANFAGYDRFQHLRRVLFWEPEKLVMIVKAKPYAAHADDSGKKNTSTLVVAGYIGEAARLEFFQKKWMDKIKKAGMGEFKRSEFNAKKHGRSFLTQLRAMIRGHVSYGFGCGIDNDAWHKLSKVYAFELYHLVPYSICARTCIGHARKWCFKHNIPFEHVAYIFDKGSQDAGELTELLKIDESLAARKTVDSLTTDCSHRIAGLQASDYLAWAIRKQYATDPNPKDIGDMNPELEDLLTPEVFEGLDKIPKFGFYFENDLINLVKRIPVPTWEELPPEILSRKRPIRFKFPAKKP
jgi:hypothetical protein